MNVDRLLRACIAGTCVFALLCAGAILAGCLGPQGRTDASASQEAIYNAAASLPPSPQRTAIMANAAATADALGHPLPEAAAPAAGAAP